MVRPAVQTGQTAGCQHTSHELSANVNFGDAAAASQLNQMVLHSVTVRHCFQVNCSPKCSSSARTPFLSWSIGAGGNGSARWSRRVGGPNVATRKSGATTFPNNASSCLQNGHQLREKITTGDDAIACSQNCAGLEPLAAAALARFWRRATSTCTAGRVHADAVASRGVQCTL